jgi:hypothetical protein
MVLRLNGNLAIENLRHYPPELLEQLRSLLVAGALAEADPHRENFYELEDRTHGFYIHVAPARGKVMLLAAWPKQPTALAAD